MIIEYAKSAEAVFFLFRPLAPLFSGGETIDE
jgi:hypothetical protein